MDSAKDLDVKQIIVEGSLNQLFNLEIDDDLKTELSLEIGKLLKKL